MQLKPGDKLGPYEIVSAIGKGGMGEVWKARDPRLNRDVAIKTSARQFTDRFEREVQVVASLNHANICTLYDVGPNYLVMELIEGPPLAERIAEGPIPLEEALVIAKQIAAALEVAHEKPIVHRDLKPANVKIKPDGSVKVLDFGLAKSGGFAEVTSDSPTLLTVAGMILGTAGYMAPEQAKGKVADKRADIWAYGVVLYEMLTGKRLFEGETISETLAAVLKEQPDLTRVPAQVRPLLRRCLEKEPAKRLRDIGDAMPLLDENAPDAAVPERAAPQRRKWLWPTTAATASAIAVAAVMFWAPWRTPAPARAMRFQVPLPENVESAGFLSVSPDGRKLLIDTTGGQAGLWIRDLEALEWRRLAGTEGARSPFWSPDSRFVGFSVGNQLKKIEIAGGPPQTLWDAPFATGTAAWNKDDVIVFGGLGGSGAPMRRVPAAGGVPADVTSLDAAHGETAHSLATFLPDGKHFLYLRTGSANVAGIYAGSLDLKPAEQSRERILATSLSAPFVDGNLLFMREGTLMRQPFDARKLRLRGEPVPLAEHLAINLAVGSFGASRDVLAYRTGTAAVGLQPAWFDRQGKMTGTFGEAGTDAGLALSPDATRAAARNALQQSNGDIWLLDFARGVRTRLTFRQSAGSYPVWSPDGSRIAFSSSSAAGGALDTIFEKAANGSGDEKELLKKPGEVKFPTSWSRDGRLLLYSTAGVPKTRSDLWVLPLDGDRKPKLLLGTEFNESMGSFSPDGRWIAYVSDESGRSEVYVRPFLAEGSSGPSLGEGKWQISKDGAAVVVPKWRNDGKEIIFRAPGGSDIAGAPMTVDVSANGAVFQAGIPKQLFAPPQSLGWDVTGDGKRFLMMVAAGQQNAQTPITVVLNWQAGLKK